MVIDPTQSILKPFNAERPKTVTHNLKSNIVCIKKFNRIKFVPKFVARAGGKFYAGPLRRFFCMPLNAKYKKYDKYAKYDMWVSKR